MNKDKEPELKPNTEKIKINEFTKEIVNLRNRYIKIHNQEQDAINITDVTNKLIDDYKTLIKEIENTYPEENKRDPLIKDQLNYLKNDLIKLDPYANETVGITEAIGSPDRLFFPEE